MKNIDSYVPTKYIIKKGILRSSKDPIQVKLSSRLVVDCIARFYDVAIPKFCKGELIDLGCGKVPLYVKYRDYVSSVTCADWKNSAHGNKYLDYEVDLTSILPFKDNSYQTIILSDVLEHIPNPDLLWSEMARILKPGGYILINVPYFYPLHEMPYDFYRYSSFALERFAKQNELEVIQLDTIGGSLEVICDILCKHFQQIPLVGKLFIHLSLVCTNLLLASKIGKSISRKTSERYPLGYFMVVMKQ
jgi:SAM-dependent methyltransferase